MPEQRQLGRKWSRTPVAWRGTRFFSLQGDQCWGSTQREASMNPLVTQVCVPQDSSKFFFTSGLEEPDNAI